MRRRQGNTIVILLVGLIVVALMLLITLIYLVRKQSDPKELENQSQETASIEEYSTGESQEKESEEGQEETSETTPEIVVSEGRMPYQIMFQQKKVFDEATITNIATDSYKVTYDMNGDGVSESIAVDLEYDTQKGTLKMKLSEPGYSTVECELEKPLTGKSIVELVGINNKNGIGIGIISRNYDSAADQYFIQAVVWECGKSTLTQHWNVVYSAVVLKNGFVGEGDIHGKIRENEFSYTMESNQNGYILQRSTLMADMKNMGIIFPRETLSPCDIEYRSSVTGLLSLKVE